MAEILGVPVRVERGDVNDADEIVAICRRGRQQQRIPILKLLCRHHRRLGGRGLKRTATEHVAGASQFTRLGDRPAATD